MPKAKPGRELEGAAPPDQRRLSMLQAKRLAGLSGLDAKEIAGHTVDAIVDKFRWIVDPPPLLFRRLCGQVVRKDPVSGAEYPVPYATVHVEDTDCNLVLYCPVGWKWAWFYPLFCHREEIATVKTDECGRFCVWIPWFDIDWILRWRKDRICFPDVFVRPSIPDLIPIDFIPPIVGPGPIASAHEPDLITRLLALPPAALSRLDYGATHDLAQRLGAMQASRALGTSAPASLANKRAFAEELPPPLPGELRESGFDQDVRRSASDAFRKTLAAKLSIDVKALEHFGPDRYLGPFLRCIDVLVPEWTLVHDVPDISFRVTQDVDGDGNEETIYSESFFDVRWDAMPLPDVTLYAGPTALVTHACDVPAVVCGNQPALLYAGLMPLTNPGGGVIPYHDAATGYAKRPNRPHPSGALIESLPRPLASTPYCRTLQLYGCVEIPGAHYYRVLYSVDDGASFSPFVGLTWPLNRAVGGPPWQMWPASDAQGWYPIVPSAQGWFPQYLVLEWRTSAARKYVLRLQVGDAGKNPIAPHAPDIALQIDNTTPTVMFDKLAWKFAAESDSAFDLPGRRLLGVCPTVHRGAAPQNVEIVMSVSVSALHLRHATIQAWGCGGGNPPLASDPSNHTQHWHTDALDNSELFYARFSVGAGLPEGAYHFACHAYSRAFNPAGHDGGHIVDWNYDPIEIYTHPAIAVAVVNSN